MSGKLGAKGLYTLLQPLLFDYWDKPLYFGFKFDSNCFLCMLNPALDLKSMLLTNTVESFKEELLKISVQFPNATISVGHIAGGLNPVAVINSEQYRYRPPLFGCLDQIEEDTVAVCRNGTFQFQGLPEKFL